MTHPAGPTELREPQADGVWEVLARWRAERRRFALITVVETRGFTPRKAGARMLLDASGETAGTIGGGAIEQVVLDEARARIPTGGAVTLRRHLTQELGMCCGGEMTVFIEVLEPAPRLALFGAGYIARPLAAMAAECGFEVTVVDARAEWASAERFPRARVVCQDPEHALASLGLAPEDYVCVVTHDHALDQRLIQVLLRMPLRFLGMVGSVPKQRKFALRLRTRGFGDADIARLHTPLGLDIGARTPEEIAISALAQLVAARRGAPVDPGWVPPAGAPAARAESQTARSEPMALAPREGERR